MTRRTEIILSTGACIAISFVLYEGARSLLGWPFRGEEIFERIWFAWGALLIVWMHPAMKRLQ